MDNSTIINTADIDSKQASTDVKNNKRAHIKVIAISLAAVCITVAVVGGFVFTFKVHAETTANIVITELENLPFRETVEEDLDDGTRLYTVYHSENTQYILYDFNRKLKLVKTEKENRCIVTTMNSTEKDVEDMHDNVEQAPLTYSVDREPVHDKSFLSKRGQKLCKHVHVYWAVKSTGLNTGLRKTNGTDHHIQKRSHVWGHTQCCGPCSLICLDTCQNVCYFYDNDDCHKRIDVYRICSRGGYCYCTYYETIFDTCCQCESSLHPIWVVDDPVS